ncbi:MAG: DEAD/DEAH box helicase [Sarcina sp.]
MNVKKLKDNVFFISSSIAKARGEDIYKKALVKGIKGKKISESYHIYGEINNNLGATILNSHLKFDLKTLNLISCNCSCLDYSENSKYNSKYICEHMVATICKFYDLAEKKISKSKIKEQKVPNEIFKQLGKEKKSNLFLSLKVKYISYKEDSYYLCRLKFNKDNKSSIINSIEEFIKAKKKENIYNFNSSLAFNPNTDCFSNEDEKILQFLEGYLELNKLITKEGNNIIKLDNIKLFKGNIRDFIKLFKGKDIEFNYNHINGISKIIEDKIPLDLYGEFNLGNILISNRKIYPFELNDFSNLIFYDGNIYLLNEEKVEIYKELFKFLKNGNKITLNKNNCLEKLAIIAKLSSKITFSNSMKNFILEESKLIFNLRKDKDEIKLDYKIKGLESKEDSFIKNPFEGSLKDKKIEFFLESLKFRKKEDEFLFKGDEEDLYNLLKFGLTEIFKLGNLEVNEEFNELKLINGDYLDGKLIKDEDEIRFNYNIDNLSELDIKRAFKSLKDGKKFYKSSRGSFLDLEDKKVVGFLNLLEIIGENEEDISKEIILKKDKAIFLEGKIRKDNLNFIEGKEKIESLNKNLLNDDKKEPKNLNGKLRNYQLVGYNWMLKLANLKLGGILADDMGLGKTIQTIAFLLEKKYNDVLIITPTALIYNWEEEFKKFAPTLKVGIVHGSKEKRKKILDSIDEYDVLITSYGMIKNDFDFYKEKVFQGIIIDEAQNIKNNKIQLTTYVKSLNGEFKLALTGTPIENNLLELWSIFDFINPGYLYTEEKFKDKFINGKDQLEDLKTLINPFILRRLKSEVLEELPEKIERKFLIEMPSAQSKIYKSYVKEIKEKIKNDKNNITIFSYITKLRELALDPSLVIKDYKSGNGKIKILKELLSENKRNSVKTLIFSQFTSYLKIIKEDLNNEGIKTFYLDGATTAKERIALVNEFNNSEESEVFLISLKAGGTGLNLTAANSVIHLDPWWNIAVENQATDRAYRIGQKNVVEVVKLIAKGTIEEKIILLQEEKKELIEEMIAGKDFGKENLEKLKSKELLDLLEI